MCTRLLPVDWLVADLKFVRWTVVRWNCHSWTAEVVDGQAPLPLAAVWVDDIHEVQGEVVSVWMAMSRTSTGVGGPAHNDMQKVPPRFPWLVAVGCMRRANSSTGGELGKEQTATTL